MRALVISGGGSKGAYAGGVAHYLIRHQHTKYDLFLGSSTGSLLLPHLALGNLNKLYNIYTNVNQNSIFSLNPFRVKRKDNREFVSINYVNSLLQYLTLLKTRLNIRVFKNVPMMIFVNGYGFPATTYHL